MNDKITLAEAFATPVWMMVWAAEPDRLIDVTMTYEDLKIIYGLAMDLQKRRKKDGV